MAQVSTGPFYRVLCMETAAMKGKKKKNALAWKVRCAMCTRHEGQQQSRRLVNISPLLIHFLSLPNRAIAGSIFDKYVKRKKLEPLEVYVPAIILTQLQIKDLEKTLEVEQPQYAACRSLLRSGPAASLRVNVRAVAQYATEAGYSDAASTSVDTCLSLVSSNIPHVGQKH